MTKHSPIYAYPAVFTPEKNGMYSIDFPDLSGCSTCGDDLEHGLMMAEDVLALTIYSDYEKDEKDVPTSTPINEIKLKKGEFVTYIVCDTTNYRRQFGTKAVKKTLSIPEWLNEAAMEEKINFSQVLQEALKERLKVG